ncbi:helix-turn-helix domain-containing protein [Amycolatopsis acidiphila]|uniref:Transcriptional regulator n=1 Tax=Amycolatopsis acidiphila TaxID=715473 RepID=A0A558AL01_9PSEU|nr:helix-turn-helix domain-containing protein [Amycolatopsis acidiphila]TVT24940.1 transcriptional regulator [Amycolatopsis acidiphila]UIJ57561.1 helix-turn-helix domain-containing protein [Amycolatopsis acidiphila]GHG89499.1 hypothetical protein GCM10017788_64280 [Amycolatopsis acidiphila]
MPNSVSMTHGDETPAPLSTWYKLLVVAMGMSERRHEDAILHLVRTSLPFLAPCSIEAAFRYAGGDLRPWPGTARADDVLVEQIHALGPGGGLLPATRDDWRWVFPLACPEMVRGFLVVHGDGKPPVDARFLFQVLGRQVGTALAGAALHGEDHAQLTRLRESNDKLTRLVTRLRRQTAVYETLTAASASGEGASAIARAVHELTGLPITIEDPFGNPLAWAGHDEPPPGTKTDARGRQALLDKVAAYTGAPFRDHERVVSVVRPGTDLLGLLLLSDPGRRAGQHELFVVGYATTILALELAHQRNLAEVELRVHRDLVDDLVEGTDDESAYARAAAVGHDLRVPHHVLVVRWNHHRHNGETRRAVQQVLRSWRRHALASRHSGATVVVVADGSVDGAALHEALARELGTGTGAIGIGGRCETPSALPRSYAQALQALDIRLGSAAPHGATAFDQLGVYRILSSTTGREHVRAFVREWLGPLLDYDAKRGSSLVRTLFQYLESGGNYDAAAAALLIHRSTLRYRLARIREIGGLDLTEVDTRLNLHVATRGWQILSSPEP